MRAASRLRPSPALHAMTEIWLIDLQRAGPALAELERASPRLTPRDRSRARAVKNPADRRQRITITTALRILLERLAGPHSARQPFGTGPAGKPALADRSLQFSLSHVEGYALIGLTRAGDIGIDLERDRPLRLSERRRTELMAAAIGLADKPLARRERAGPSPDAAFLQAWCRLEAFAKARGLGIGRTLADLGLRSGQPRTPADIEVACRSAARAAQLTVRDLPLGRGLYGAIAIKNAARLRPHVFPTNRTGIERLLARPGPPFAAPPPRRLTRTPRRGTREPFGA
jgi:4'-phosphopantetheinyl transferase